MNRKRKLALLWGVVSAALLCFFIGVAYPKLPINSILQNQTLNQNQQSFVAFMVPKINLANQQIYNLRERIILVVDKIQQGKISQGDRRFLLSAAQAYDVANFNADDPNSVNELLRRVDIVPTSLVLAQAADESGWGASHFAKAADNFFGQHCYTEGCGLTPGTGAHTDFEVEKFNDAQDAINYYLYNLNTTAAYAQFREARARLRAEGKPITGSELVPYLKSYSILGTGYIDMINSMILAHGFSQYDQSYPDINPNSIKKHTL